MNDRDLFRTVYRELENMVRTSFPKKCANCGREYKNLEEFLAATQDIGRAGALLESFEHDPADVGETPVVDLTRNCVCGSSLLVVFPDRRDTSDQGKKMREKFGESLSILVSNGIVEDTARAELLKIMKGGSSVLIDDFLNKADGPDISC